MNILKLRKKVKSQIDSTIKYVFEKNGQVVEFSYIDNNTGKDIICVPCQTMCNMSCTFCHLTDYVGKIKLNNLKGSDIVYGVNYIADDLSLGNRDFLISYMGCGEPLDNVKEVFDSIKTLNKSYDQIRFGMATMLPKKKWEDFFLLTKWVKENNINLKMHLSLHFTNDSERYQWMPSAFEIFPSIEALKFYNITTGNETEVHYTIMDGVNDSFDDMEFLEKHIPKNTTIKFMMYSEKDNLDVQKVNQEKLEIFMDYLKRNKMIVEYYEPPGHDVGSSCGVFLKDIEEYMEKEEGVI